MKYRAKSTGGSAPTLPISLLNYFRAFLTESHVSRNKMTGQITQGKVDKQLTNEIKKLSKQRARGPKQREKVSDDTDHLVSTISEIVLSVGDKDWRLNMLGSLLYRKRRTRRA